MFNIKPDIKEIKNKINEDGNCLINNCNEKNVIKELRNYWLNKIQYFNKSKKHVRGKFHLGNENIVSFSKKIIFHCIDIFIFYGIKKKVNCLDKLI